MQLLFPGLAALTSVEALRLLLSWLPDDETTPHHLVAVAAVPVFATAIIRNRQGFAPIAPDASLTHSADFLRMLSGTLPSTEKVRALDTYLTTVADHGLNASTFTARVIASTGAGLFSSVVGALCALKGPLHGGAPGPVLDMLDAIGAEAEIEPWLLDALGRGERLMGFGHRIYRVRDPRADVLKHAVSTLKEGSDRIAFAGKVEEAALALLKERSLCALCRPMSNSIPHSCWKRWVFRAIASPMSLRPGVWRAGQPMSWNRSGQAASFAHNPTISVHIQGEISRSSGEQKIPPAYF